MNNCVHSGRPESETGPDVFIILVFYVVFFNKDYVDYVDYELHHEAAGLFTPRVGIITFVLKPGRFEYCIH